MLFMFVSFLELDAGPNRLRVRRVGVVEAGLVEVEVLVFGTNVLVSDLEPEDRSVLDVGRNAVLSLTHVGVLLGRGIEGVRISIPVNSVSTTGSDRDKNTLRCGQGFCNIEFFSTQQKPSLITTITRLMLS